MLISEINLRYHFNISQSEVREEDPRREIDDLTDQK